MKEKLYNELLMQLKGLIDGETDTVAVLANTAALLHDIMGDRFFWTGFYIVRGDELVLGPFQGTIACYRIKRGRGVCGTAWDRGETIVVPDVERFPGHIACSSLSRSEIVVPVRDADGRIAAVLDIDSRDLDAFDDTDARHLNSVAALLAPFV